jgi:hypothetical protein
VPGTGKTVGFYNGKPKGVSLRGLPVRDLNGKTTKTTTTKKPKAKVTRSRSKAKAKA